MPDHGTTQAMVREAAERIRPHVVRTPLVRSATFSGRFGFPVFLKLENLQTTGAFKLRGATNAVLALRDRGVTHVVAASSGSHAMGVSLAARGCGMKATIVMPEGSPELKRRKVRSYGADLIVDGQAYDDAVRVAQVVARETGAVLVHGLEDELVMAGHGTMGLEIVEDLPEVDLVAVPVGGGGALSGLLMALKETHPHVRVWGVESDGAPSMKLSLDRGEPTELTRMETVADAIAVRRPGRRAFAVVRDLADGVTTVPDRLLLENVGRLALGDKLVAEPASAATLSADWPALLDFKPRAAVFIITGGNISRDLLTKALSAVGEDVT
ncbi:MAG TPA: threonine ammonia-lyase [Clostridiales bacterium]|nr:threonine ammonia-lyase [Clostridiales bacterium]